MRPERFRWWANVWLALALVDLTIGFFVPPVFNITVVIGCLVISTVERCTAYILQAVQARGA